MPSLCRLTSRSGVPTGRAAARCTAAPALRCVRDVRFYAGDLRSLRLGARDLDRVGGHGRGSMFTGPPARRPFYGDGEARRRSVGAGQSPRLLALELTDVVDTWVAQRGGDPSGRQRPREVRVPAPGDHP